MGSSYNDIDNNNCNVNNLLITGPNASGKSTCIKAIIESIVLGQTILCCPQQNVQKLHHLN